LFRSLTLALVLGGVAWFTRDRWMPRVLGPSRAEVAAPGGEPAKAEAPWVRVSDSSAARGRRATDALQKKNGPAFVSVDGEDAAALALAEFRKRLPSGMTDVAVRVEGEQVEVRAVVRPADFGGKEMLGPIFSLLPDRDTMRLTGTLEGVRAGLGEFRVRSIRFRDIPLPTKAIAPLLRQVARGSQRPAGVADDAFPVPLPSYIGDVRVRDGRVTLYRAAP
jgi:hypothetical protein